MPIINSHDIANDSHAYAKQARQMAESLESTDPKASKLWHSVADSLFEAVQALDNAHSYVKTTTKQKTM